MPAPFSSREHVIRLPFLLDQHARERRPIDELTADLQASTAREEALQLKIDELNERQTLHAAEVEHRCLNGLQRIASLLSVQIRTASPEAAAELTVAVSRIVALGKVHRQLTVNDRQDDVEVKPYLHELCGELSRLFNDASGHVIAVDAANLRAPADVASTLGFIVAELITNAVKHARGDIAVRLEETPSGHALIVCDDGPGLPPGFDAATCKGLGMKIVRSYVAQIGGALHISSGVNSRGACFAVSFDAGRFAAG